MTSPNDPSWFRASFMSNAPDIASAMLWAAGAAGVEVHDHDTHFEGIERTPLPQDHNRLVAYFEVEPQALAALRERLGALAPHAHLLEFAPFTDTSWKTAWKAFFHPRRLSARSIVTPPWDEGSPQEGDVRIVIEPGMAFGTGTHETTQLVSGLLDDLLADDPHRSILDVGTGSAILSMLAAKLGATKEIRGIDIDLDAIESARGNLPLNDIDPQRIDLSITDISEIDETYELVLANILGHILLALQPELQAHTAPGGTLILSGMIEHQVPLLREAFAHSDWVERAHHHLDPWHALVLERLR